MDHITNDTSLIGPRDEIPVEAGNERFLVFGHRNRLVDLSFGGILRTQNADHMVDAEHWVVDGTFKLLSIK